MRKINKIETLISIASALIAGAANADSKLWGASRSNESIIGFMTLAPSGIEQGFLIGNYSSKGILDPDGKDMGILGLAKWAIDAGFPTRKEERSTMGYSPRIATIVTLLKNERHTIEIDLDFDFGMMVKTIVKTKTLADAKEVSFELDRLALAKSMLILSGDLAREFSAAVSDGLIETSSGVFASNPVFKNFEYGLVYHSGLRTVPNAVVCGDRAFTNKFSCVLFAN